MNWKNSKKLLLAFSFGIWHIFWLKSQDTLHIFSVHLFLCCLPSKMCLFICSSQFFCCPLCIYVLKRTLLVEWPAKPGWSLVLFCLSCHRKLLPRLHAHLLPADRQQQPRTFSILLLLLFLCLLPIICCLPTIFRLPCQSRIRCAHFFLILKFLIKTVFLLEWHFSRFLMNANYAFK